MNEPKVSVRERRTIPLELRVQRSADGKAKIVGYAAKFNSLSEDLGGFREVIAPGAFKGVLDNDVRGLFNHDPNFVLGRTTAGTARMSEDADGLMIEIDPPETEQARTVITAIERGDVTGQSFSFQLPPYPDGRIWEENEKGELTRTITRIDRLFDFGPVTFPAYPDTDVSMRSLESALTEGRAALKEKAAPDFSVMRKRIDLEASR